MLLLIIIIMYNLNSRLVILNVTSLDEYVYKILVDG